MGIFWDLMQQEALENQKAQSETLEDRIDHLEQELKNTKALLRKTLEALETHIVKDIDGDGKLGKA